MHSKVDGLMVRGMNMESYVINQVYKEVSGRIGSDRQGSLSNV